MLRSEGEKTWSGVDNDNIPLSRAMGVVDETGTFFSCQYSPIHRINLQTSWSRRYGGGGKPGAPSFSSGILSLQASETSHLRPTLSLADENGGANLPDSNTLTYPSHLEKPTYILCTYIPCASCKLMGTLFLIFLFVFEYFCPQSPPQQTQGPHCFLGYPS